MFHAQAQKDERAVHCLKVWFKLEVRSQELKNNRKLFVTLEKKLWRPTVTADNVLRTTLDQFKLPIPKFI